MSIVITPPAILLSEPDADLVRALAADVASSDGVMPLNESARLALGGYAHLRSHWLARESGPIGSSGRSLLGYAHWDGREQTVQIMVAPDARRRGIGTALARAVVGHTSLARASNENAPIPESLMWWAFGSQPPAQGFAASLGLRPVRGLLVMSMTLPCEVSRAAGLPEGLRLDSYRSDDLDRLVEVNHAAFEQHPEQGAMTAADALARMSQDWFDPAGLLVARDDAGRIVGFHWTKIETVAGTRRGEVYVLGVHPDWEHRGVGRALLDAGILHMQDRGAQAIDLYVEAGNPRVVHMYQSSGFQVTSTDTAYARVPAEADQEQN
ncbi:mycothiol synthase [Propionibacterium australiense]|uniref:Mycothiol acetyltransferase n=1 Tax=Propionibacterium australiense TaxID=119981 RepID=A0A383S831_9ACTN|nr:mycothiol synthase [Propionibacterium australiense]RLP09015.1 mycothiol synthase [Propionibacterium australiense]RLP09051.1 mycothiol synthase [Propionibacterium australiense]SYZ33416.1 mycothiol synthase [Propionibacterium australiense]VEH91889.1 Mycothiol acetyltransferase [Propionibacterium australiense]